MFALLQMFRLAVDSVRGKPLTRGQFVLQSTNLLNPSNKSRIEVARSKIVIDPRFFNLNPQFFPYSVARRLCARIAFALGRLWESAEGSLYGPTYSL
ncbi:MAG: hypothetical protein DMG05_28805 [Acidobacteria bacterium]|nr:MAG: hypothetical protein DMG05_28805 [Acidobacteriota bacterium]